jgi:diguanylate cyclase (GGDEF)-like protein
VVSYDSASIQLLDEDGRLRLAAGRGFPDPEQARRVVRELSDHALRQKWRERKPIVIPDTHNDSRWMIVPGTEYIRSWVGAPMMIGGRLIGTLNVDSRTANAYDESVAETVMAFANQAAVAIENARLFETAQRRAEEAETLRQAGAVVAATLDLDETIQRILEQLERVVPYDSASVQLLHEGYVEIVGGRGWPDPSVVLGLRFPIPDDNPNTVVIQERRPYILGDAPAAHPPFREDPHSHIRSWLGVPLIVGERVIGMLTVDSTEPHHFTEEHARLATAFADQVAIALENARLFRAEQERREIMATLLEITQVAGSSLELKQVLKHIAQHTARVCQAHRCSIFLLDESGEYVQPVMSQFADGHVDLELWQRFKTTGADRVDAVPLFRSAIRERRPTLLEDPERTDLLPRRWTQPYDIQKLLVVPLIAHDRVIGLMALDHTDPRREFTSEQIELALTIGGRVAASVENARLYATERERTRQLEALHQATTTLLATLERETLLDRILSSALRIIPAAEKGTLLLIDRETGRLRIRAIQGYEDPRVQTFAATFTANAGHAAQAVHQRRPLLINDTLIHPALRHDGDIAEIRAIRSALVVPLLLQDEAIGALSLEATRTAAFTEEDLRLLTTFAATAATAIRNAQLHAEVQELATTDPLTGLYNRRAFFELGHREVERARRFGRPLTAIMFDLDHFKRVNDMYGHAIGDQVLAGLAKLCQQELREVDLLGRYGGEEFVVLLPETNVAGAWQVAERLRRRIAQAEIPTDRGAMQITLSLGIAALSEECADLESLLECADRALYAAKQAGRNRVRVWGVSEQ